MLVLTYTTCTPYFEVYIVVYMAEYYSKHTCMDMDMYILYNTHTNMCNVYAITCNVQPCGQEGNYI